MWKPRHQVSLAARSHGQLEVLGQQAPSKAAGTERLCVPSQAVQPGRAVSAECSAWCWGADAHAVCLSGDFVVELIPGWPRGLGAHLCWSSWCASYSSVLPERSPVRPLQGCFMARCQWEKEGSLLGMSLVCSLAHLCWETEVDVLYGKWLMLDFTSWRCLVRQNLARNEPRDKVPSSYDIPRRNVSQRKLSLISSCMLQVCWLLILITAVLKLQIHVCKKSSWAQSW